MLTHLALSPLSSGTGRLKLKHDKVLSSSALNVNLRRYTTVMGKVFFQAPLNGPILLGCGAGAYTRPLLGST
jgi:hypothetical protein